MPTKKEKQEIINAVDKFAEAMKARMLSKLNQGWGGWDCPSMKDVVADRMLLNAANGKVNKDAKSLVDTANLAMMIWSMEAKV